jgi:hypothetical protein
MEYQAGLVSESESVTTFVVYRRSDGRIVHTHYVIAAPGAEVPGTDRMAGEAAELARDIAGSGEGESDVGVLQVEARELRSGAQYVVDVEAQRLVIREDGRDEVSTRGGPRDVPEET